MRVLVQRVARAAVHIDGEPVASIGPGLLLLVAFTTGDGDADLAWMAEKVAHLRIFEDAAGKMNRSLLEAGGQALVVSQFTLYADARKGRRPSFDASAPADRARPLFEKFVDILATRGIITAAGRFQAVMQVELVNDGPVTILLDSAAGGSPRGPSESSHGRDPCRG
jgi:D-tyrosyl-tRNA(Tyr) deacylase